MIKISKMPDWVFLILIQINCVGDVFTQSITAFCGLLTEMVIFLVLYFIW